jgi:hypothetical protein
MSEQPSGWLRIARNARKTGLIGLAIIGVFAVMVFIFDVPVRNENTNELMSRSDTVGVLLDLAYSFAFVAIIGWLALFWLKPKP